MLGLQVQKSPVKNFHPSPGAIIPGMVHEVLVISENVNISEERFLNFRREIFQ